MQRATTYAGVAAGQPAAAAVSVPVRATPALMVKKALLTVTAAAIAAGSLHCDKILTRPIRAYVADTGCGSDLINQSSMTSKMVSSETDAPNPVFFETANGSASVDKVTHQRLKHFDEGSSEFVMASSPDVLSTGYRCEALGYGFYWPLYSTKPFMLKPKEAKIHGHWTPPCPVIQLYSFSYVPYYLDEGNV